MSKMYRKNGNSWLEVKKGFKIKYAGNLIELKSLKFRYNGLWNEHKFSSIAMLEHGNAIKDGREHSMTRLINFDTGVEIKRIDLGISSTIYSRGAAGYKDRLYKATTYDGSYNATVNEVNTDNLSIIRSTTGLGVLRQLAGTATKLYATGPGVAIHEVNPNSLTSIATSSIYSYEAFGGMSDKLFGRYQSTNVEINTENYSHIRYINSLIPGTVDGAEIKSYSGNEDRLFISMRPSGTSDFYRKELNPANMAIISQTDVKSENFYNSSLAITKE